MGEKKCIFNTALTTVKNNIKELFGSPNEGIHTYRIFNIAYIDVLLTIIGALIIQKIFYPKTKYWKILGILFIIGIVLHRLFNVRTTMDKFLFN